MRSSWLLHLSIVVCSIGLARHNLCLSRRGQAARRSWNPNYRVFLLMTRKQHGGNQLLIQSRVCQRVSLIFMSVLLEVEQVCCRQVRLMTTGIGARSHWASWMNQGLIFHVTLYRMSISILFMKAPLWSCHRMPPSQLCSLIQTRLCERLGLLIMAFQIPNRLKHRMCSISYQVNPPSLPHKWTVHHF